MPRVTTLHIKVSDPNSELRVLVSKSYYLLHGPSVLAPVLLSMTWRRWANFCQYGDGLVIFILVAESLAPFYSNQIRIASTSGGYVPLIHNTSHYVYRERRQLSHKFDLSQTCRETRMLFVSEPFYPVRRWRSYVYIMRPRSKLLSKNGNS